MGACCRVDRKRENHVHEISIRKGLGSLIQRSGEEEGGACIIPTTSKAWQTQVSLSIAGNPGPRHPSAAIDEIYKRLLLYELGRKKQSTQIYAGLGG